MQLILLTEKHLWLVPMMVLLGDSGALCWERVQPPEIRLLRIKGNTLF